DNALKRDPANAVSAWLGEPEVAVRPGGDSLGVGAAGYAELCDGTLRRDAADGAAATLGEPEVAVLPGRDVLGGTVGGEAGAKLGDGHRRLATFFQSFKPRQETHGTPPRR